ncbi:MAG: amidohydrolase [Vicinamibacterales bacterium]
MASRGSIVLLVAAAAAGCTPSAPPPPSPAVTLAVVNAVVWTGDPAHPQAEAVAIAGDRIVAVGTSAEIRARAGGAEVIDAQGQFVTPGFIDSHVHFIDGGRRLASVQLRDAATPEEFTRRIAAFARTVPAGTWITGGDWDHQRWGGALPERAWIDAVTPDHPVWVNRLDGHMALANTAALRAVGLTGAVNDVAGGEVVRDRRGAPTGLLKDNAMALVESKMPPPDAAALDRALEAAMDYVGRQGVTSVHHMGTWDDLDVFERGHRAGTLTTRIYAAVPLDSWEKLDAAIRARTYGGSDGRGDTWLHIGNLKGFVDGSLGSHTAAMQEPFTDTPSDRGLFVTPPEQLYAWVSGADAAGLQVSVHAIGDRAIATQLDIFDRVMKEHGARDRRFRIEHAQHPAAPDIPRFAQLGIIASMQPYHAIDDGRWAETVIGPRIATTYAFRSMLDARVALAFGSDWFVAPPAPLEGIYAAVTRRTLDGRHPDGWVPAQKISVDEALAAYTRTAAYAEFAEEQKGALAPGRLADLVVIDRDLRRVAPPEIRDAVVTRTIVGGRTVYSR